MADTDKVCCSLPPVTTHSYAPKGTYTELAGLKIYTTGSSTSKKALIGVYDVFGYVPQTFQGADRLANSLDGLVLMPDLFKAEPLPLSLYPPNTDERKKTVGKFMQTKANIYANIEKLLELMKEAKGEYTKVEGWGVYGLCWGGKLAVLTSGPNTEFKAAGTAHPSRLAKEDAEALTVPFICLLSKEDGTPELMREYTEALGKKQDNVVERYSAMHHGWMGARADFESEDNVNEFERGYHQLANFFAKHL